MTREEANSYRTGDGYYELKFSEAEMRDAFNDGFLVAIDGVLEIIDDEIASWEQARDELGCKPEDDNAEAALAIARSRIAEQTEGGEQDDTLNKTKRAVRRGRGGRRKDV